MEHLDVPTPLGRVALTVARGGPEVVVLWPSLLMTGALWTAQLEHLAPARTAVAIDPPGHGRSEPLTGPFGFDACVAVLDAVLDAVGAADAHVVGNSWGGMTGITYAATRPERTRSLVTMNSTASPAPRRQRLEYGALTVAARLRGGLKPPLDRSAVDAFLGPTSKRERPAVVEHVRTAARTADVGSVRHAITSVVPRRPDQRPLLAQVRCPTLVVAGREDATFPVAENRVIADGIGGARFEVLEDAAHLAALEVPERVNALLDDFLGDAPS